MNARRFDRVLRWLFLGLAASVCGSCGCRDALASSTPSAEPLAILFAGDTSFGEAYMRFQRQQGKIDVLREKGYDYPFTHLETILRDADLAIANLEAPITDLEPSPFAGRKEYLNREHGAAAARFAKLGFDAFSLANNHTLDFGLPGLQQTVRRLAEQRIESFGAGSSEGEASRPLSRQFRVGRGNFQLAVLAGYHYRQDYDEQLGWYAQGARGGVRVLDPVTLAAQISELKRQQPNLFLVVFPHWGSNYRWKGLAQTLVARRLVTAGADLILGHGAHQLQEIERIDGRWVVYGLGNFVFNSQGRYQKKSQALPYSLIARLLVSPATDALRVVLRLYPIFCDNLITGFQNRFVDRDELENLHRQLLGRTPDLHLTLGEDPYGLFFELPVRGSTP